MYGLAPNRMVFLIKVDGPRRDKILFERMLIIRDQMGYLYDRPSSLPFGPSTSCRSFTSSIFERPV